MISPLSLPVTRCYDKAMGTSPVSQVSVNVRMSDLDVFGHVNNARFLTFTEEARRVLLTSPPMDTTRMGQGGVILARITVDFHAPVVPPEWAVTVRTAVTQIGRSSVGLRHTIHHGTTHAATLTVVVVAFDHTALTTRLLDAEERTALEICQEATADQLREIMSPRPPGAVHS